MTGDIDRLHDRTAQERNAALGEQQAGPDCAAGGDGPARSSGPANIGLVLLAVARSVEGGAALLTPERDDARAVDFG